MKEKSQGIDPVKLWSKITKESNYTKWSFWPDHKGMKPGVAPHGPLHKVFVNKLALNAKKAPLPYGSIVVKENYSKAKELKAITVMYKIKDYNPTKGDWFWAKYTPKGKADKFGKPKGCVNCHGAKADNDHVMVRTIK